MNETNGFGVLLRRYRLAAGLTQEALAERAAVSVRGLSDLERGLHRAPHAETERRLVEALALGPTERLAIQAAGRKRATSAVVSNGTDWAVPLAQPLSSFVGRRRELSELRELMAQTRMLTLTGAGGVGKTRLARRLAEEAHRDYRDGVRWVELATVAEPALIYQAIAHSMGVHEQRGRPLLDTLLDMLGERHVLLVLDNCEHLIEACAQLADHLLRSSQQVHLLATSREPLGLAGEVAWRVPCLSETEAVELFTQRAQAAESTLGATVTGHGESAIAEICRRLDGLPLAIELAAARARVLAPEEIVARLDNRFALLVGGTRLAPPRHQTLRAAVDWSYALLDLREQLLFQQLSVFVGSFNLAATEFVCNQATDVLDVLAGLVDRSLVLAEWAPDLSETRYRLLDTLRAYGGERLQADAGQATLVQTRHSAWTMQLAEQAARAYHGPDEDSWLHRLERERDNLRAALAWLTTHDDPDAALRLVAALGWFDGLRGPWSEGRMWVERALAMPGAEAPTAARGHALVQAALLAVFQADTAAAEAWLDEAVALGQQFGLEDVLLAARGVMTLYLQFKGAVADAERLADDLIDVARGLGKDWWAGRILSVQAAGAQHRGDDATAETRLVEALQLARLTGDRWSQAMVLSQLGDVHRAKHTYARAAELYAESLSLRDTAAPGGTGEASLWHNFGYVALANQDLPGAAADFRQALALFDHLGERRGMAEALLGLGAVAAADGRAEVAARLFGTGEAVLESLGSRMWQSNRAEYDRWLAIAREALAPDDFARAWSLGRQTSLQVAIGYTRDS